MTATGQVDGYQLNYRERIVVWVWERMAAVYGERWTRNYGLVWDRKRERARKRNPKLWPQLGRTAGLWARYIGELQPEALERAVLRAEQRADPPTLPEFMASARNDDGRVERRGAPEPEEREETEAQRQARRRHGRQVLSNLRDILDHERGDHAGKGSS